MARILAHLGLSSRLRGSGPQRHCACPIRRPDGQGRTFSVNPETTCSTASRRGAARKGTSSTCGRRCTNWTCAAALDLVRMASGLRAGVRSGILQPSRHHGRRDLTSAVTSAATGSACLPKSSLRRRLARSKPSSVKTTDFAFARIGDVSPFVQAIHGFPIEAFPRPRPVVQPEEEQRQHRIVDLVSVQFHRSARTSGQSGLYPRKGRNTTTCSRICSPGMYSAISKISSMAEPMDCSLVVAMTPGTGSPAATR